MDLYAPPLKQDEMKVELLITRFNAYNFKFFINRKIKSVWNIRWDFLTYFYTIIVLFIVLSSWKLEYRFTCASWQKSRMSSFRLVFYFANFLPILVNWFCKFYENKVLHFPNIVSQQNWKSISVEIRVHTKWHN